MDPNACFSDLIEAIAEDDEELAQERASDLLYWLSRGGFAPGGGQLRENAIRSFCKRFARL